MFVCIMFVKQNIRVSVQFESLLMGRLLPGWHHLQNRSVSLFKFPKNDQEEVDSLCEEPTLTESWRSSPTPTSVVMILHRIVL